MDQDQQAPQQKADTSAVQSPATPPTAPTPTTPGIPADQPIQENTPGMEDNSGSMPKKRALALLAVLALVGIAFLITQLLR
jgi:hypothetical protein